MFNNETFLYFKQICFILLENCDKSISPIIREWVNAIYKINSGYRIIWNDLIDNLLLILNKKNYFVSYEVYELIATFTVRYTDELKSARLFEEIIDCMKICKVMTEDALFLLSNLPTITQNNNYPIFLNILKNIIIIAYNFNYQDFPEFFEDNLKDWMSIIYSTCNLVLSYQSPEIVEINIEALKILNLYLNSYLEDIKVYSSSFQDPIWNLVANLDMNSSKNERLIFEVIEYYKISFMYKNTYDFDKVNIILNKLIFPNLIITNKEIEDFENDNVAFMKSEIEEVDEQTSKIIYLFFILKLYY